LPFVSSFVSARGIVPGVGKSQSLFLLLLFNGAVLVKFYKHDIFNYLVTILEN
jgi:hypothetical protein